MLLLIRTYSLIFFSIVLFSNKVKCQENTLHYIIKSWNIENGLPQNTVKSIIQSTDGYIWLGTFGGVARFDGIKFTVFDESNTAEFISDRVLSLTEIQKEIWIAFENGGIVKYSNGKFTRVHLPGTDSTVTVLSIFVTRDGSVWIQTLKQGLYRYSKNLFQYYGTDQGLPQEYFLCQDLQGNLFVAYEKGLLQYNNEHFIPSKYKFDSHNELSTSPYFDKNGGLWVAKRNFGIQYYPPDSFLPTLEYRSLLSSWVRKIHQDSKGNIWFTTEKGINVLTTKSFIAFTKKDGLTDNEIISFCEDSEENIWLGTKTNGLLKLRENPLKTFLNTASGAVNNYTSLIVTTDNNILAGVNCGGINIISPNGTVTELVINHNVLNTCVWSLYEDKKGTLWIGTWGGGLYIVPRWKQQYQKRAIQVREFTLIPASVILAIAEESGNMWFGTLGKGVFQLRNNGELLQYNSDQGLPANEVRCIVPANDGGVWIGTSAGIARITNEKILPVVFTEAIKGKTVRAIYEDNEKTLWVGTYGKGLIKITENGAFAITKEDGLYDNLVSQIIEDKLGRLWMGSNRGIFAVAKSQINDYINGKVTKIYPLIYTATSGMVNSETNGGFSPAVGLSENGYLWFPTLHGVVRVNSNNAKNNEDHPPVYIENLTLDDKQIPMTHVIELPYSHQRLMINFTTLSYSEPEKNTFRYILSGLNSQWFNAGTRREAIFNRIPPGEYTFLVHGYNNTGTQSNTPASIKIIVHPPFWMQTWFLIIVAGLFLLSGPSFYFWRVRILKKRAKLQEDFSRKLIESQENERKRIAGELHDSLSQHLLLIKNHAQIALQQAEKETQSLPPALGEISELATEALNESRKIAHNLRPVQLDRLGLTETIRQLLRSVMSATTIAIEYEINDIDGILDEKNEILFFRVIQEIINNMLKHSGAASFTLILENLNGSIHLYANDDGTGFDTKLLDEKNTAIKGMGISGIYERVRILNGVLQIKSNIGGGTTIVIDIPGYKRGIN